jgi:NADH:ubiquinone oxidoreductase subunit 3 (subunit A)
VTESFDALLGPVIIVLADIVVFTLVSRLGKRTSGRGKKYEPFAGGEESVPTRGLYRSSLFVFAALFLVVEAFVLLLAGSFLASGAYYPLLFLAGGGSALTITVWWFLYVGGGEF